LGLAGGDCKVQIEKGKLQIGPLGVSRKAVEGQRWEKEIACRPGRED
jgi:hypothetical protein